MNYILQRGGVYYWTDEIPVVEEFEQLCQRADAEEDPDQRLGWYQGLFCTCVKKSVTFLRGRQNYLQMEELGLYAAKINPLSDWETVTMEARVFLGWYEDAKRCEGWLFFCMCFCPAE